MKRIFRSTIVAILGWQVRRLYKKHSFKVVVVAGSIGKTSTKNAVVSMLEQSFRVRSQEGNYNHPVTVPLVFFGLPLPSLFNPIAWLVAFGKVEARLGRDYPYDVVVVEIGTDYPGNLAEFRRYLRADIGVLTAIVPEHMEFFDDLDAVAEEELTVADLSETLLANTDLCDKKYLKNVKHQSYGSKESAGFRMAKSIKPDAPKSQHYSMAAAIAVADHMGMDDKAMRKGAEAIKAVKGRMNRLKGIKNSTILDDTYNASPEATRASLDALYEFPAKQRVALLGNMNELGDHSIDAHSEIGHYCDPKKLDLVVTLGHDANGYLAPAAVDQGCEVAQTKTPHEAADVIKKHLKKDAVILAKGSQNGVYAEEAVKQLLANPADKSHLVRQSEHWMKKKRKWLGDLS